MEEKTWNNVMTRRLGLRVAKEADDINGAAFGLDDGISYGSPPEDWIFKLKNTLKWQIGFAQTHDRHYLLIVENCPTSENDREYSKDMFPKCHRVPANSTIVASTALADKDANDLFCWVNDELP